MLASHGGRSEGVFGRVDAPAPDDAARSSWAPLFSLKSSARDAADALALGLRVRAARFLDMEAHKRRRDEDGAIVTFYAPNRTFARVYKGASGTAMRSSYREIDCTILRSSVGQSLEETKSLVRKKLGLSEDTSIRFSRLHEGKVIELDDGESYGPSGLEHARHAYRLDEDFEAFRHLARYVSSLDVSVFVGQNGPPIFTQQTARESTMNRVRPRIALVILKRLNFCRAIRGNVTRSLNQ